LNQKVLGDLVGDYFFVCPTNLFANVFAEQGGKVYYYFFTQKVTYVGTVNPKPAISYFNRRRLSHQLEASGYFLHDEKKKTRKHGVRENFFFFSQKYLIELCMGYITTNRLQIRHI